MNITQVDLNNKRQVQDFLHLPFSVYKDIPQWVPPLQMDERIRLNSKRFPFYRHSHAAFFLAYKRSSPVGEGTRAIGRLAVLDNHHYNEYNKESTAFFYLFECENNPEAAKGLFTAAFDWARSRGLPKLSAPKDSLRWMDSVCLSKVSIIVPRLDCHTTPPTTSTWSRRRDSSNMASRFLVISARALFSPSAFTNLPSAS